MSKRAAAISPAGPSVLQDGTQLMSMPLGAIPRDVPLHYPIYVKVNEKYVLFRNAGDVLSGARADQLTTSKVESAYLSKIDLMAFVSTLEKGLENIGVRTPNEANAMGLRNLIHVYWKMLEDQGEVDINLFSQIRDATAKVPIVVAKDRGLAVKLLKRYQDPAEYYSNHSVNVSLYAVAIGMKMRLSEAQLADLALAGCAANIGIIEVPKEILYKDTPLTEAEWAIVRQHPKRSEEILKLLFAPPAVIAAAAEHHEHFDGTGYPKGLKGDEISLLGRIICIAEVYNALTSPKPWGPAIQPSAAVDKMAKMEGRFDPTLLSFVVK